MSDTVQAEYTLVIPHEQTCELIQGRVPHDVLIACISAVKALHEPVAESVAKNRRPSARKAGAA